MGRVKGSLNKKEKRKEPLSAKLYVTTKTFEKFCNLKSQRRLTSDALLLELIKISGVDKNILRKNICCKT